ncbi:MAG: 2-hydroxyacid dehydrogenase [Gammaproteobacteria bacterium]|nr:2-hydroxyacid dehydrogenase [Gammaproteobacteria bacterium]
MRTTIALTRPGTPYLLEQLEQRFDVVRCWQLDADPAALRRACAGVRILVTDGMIGAHASRIDTLPALELIASLGVGYDSIDVAYAASRGVRVTNTPDVLTDDVADLALAFMLALSRRLLPADRYVRAGEWPNGPFALGHRFGSRRIGVLGLGRIGRAIALRVQACGCEVVYHGRHAQADVPWPYYPDLVAMARAVDVLVVAVPGGAATDGLVSRAVLEALGPAGVLVNIARGSIVDERALVESLVSGALGGAGLDVFADEPRVPAALFTLDNVVLQPHQGSATRETRQAMADLVLANIDAYLAGRPLLTPVP